MLGQHVGARRQSVHQERTEQDRHRRAGRHAEGDGRNEMAALLGIVGAFRRDHAAHVARAETFRVLLGALGIAISDPVDHCGADAGYGAEADAEHAAAQDQPPVPRHVAHAFPLTRQIDVRRIVSGNAFARDRKLGEFRQRENAEGRGNERHAVPQIEPVEGPTQRAALRARADHRDHQAEAGGGQPLERGAAGQRRHHRHAEQGEGEKLGRTDREHDRAQDRNAHRKHDGADDAAGERRGKSGAESAASLAVTRHSVAVDHGRGGADMAGYAEQDCGDKIRRRDHRRHAKEQREGGVFVEIVSKRNQHRHADNAV